MRRRLLALSLLAACSSNHPTSPSDGPGGSGSDGGTPPPPPGSFAPTFTFESGPVRPLALSADGTRLYAANTSNSSLDILDVTGATPTVIASTYVGIDPVAVAVRTPDEVWVVNAVSDSVSVVDVSTSPPHVKRTLLVGDEPSDIVFASGHAFITTAHRGQRRSDPALASVPGAGDPQLTTAGVGRADVWVFDPDSDIPSRIVTLFGDTPRGLAVTPDGKTVYASIFKSGNQTTTTSSLLPCNGFDSATKTTTCTVNGVAIPGAPPGPATNYNNLAAPRVAMTLKQDAAGKWRDILGRDWTAATNFTLPDQDVFAIDATTFATTTSYQHVGTTLFGLAVNPANGHVYVSNTEARNDLRFEGPGTFAGTTLQGHIAESRITVLSPAGSVVQVVPRYLDKHIDYNQLPAPANIAAHSVATPLDLAVTADGAKLYVSAFGSSKLFVYSTTALEADSFDPMTNPAIQVTGGGPSGIVLDEAHGKLYVATRFDDGVSTIDLASQTEANHTTLANPEPAVVTTGRRFLYDATIASSNGEASCASCHMFGDKDNLAWDLGNPDADQVTTPINIKLSQGAGGTINGTGQVSALHPMKGPMTTQTLRGLVNEGTMHWRGDRVSGFFGTDQSGGPPYDSKLAFDNFIVAFQGLLGLGAQFDTTQMHAFTAFALAIAEPPNPIRALDNSLDSHQAAGRKYFMGCDGLDSLSGQPANCDANDKLLSGAGHFSDGVAAQNFGFTCNGCHTLDPANGFFGTDGESSFEALPQIMKIPHLRNLYDKVGMFGVPNEPGTNPGDNGNKGAQLRGTGFSHDGSVDTVFRFLQASVFNATSGNKIGFANGDTQRRDLEQYLLAFDTDLAPIVGQQVTLRSDNAATAGPRIDLLIQRASAPFTSKLLGSGAHECDLVARTSTATYLLSGTAFVATDGTTLDDAGLRALATAGNEITYTCVPPGWVHS
ncbi:MAG: hypothetical protein QM831_29240 [Kofleriaceae bacterium]